jgi:putative lipoprotein
MRLLKFRPNGADVPNRFSPGGFELRWPRRFWVHVVLAGLHRVMNLDAQSCPSSHSSRRCSVSPSAAAQSSLSGTVIYRERVALSPEAVLELTLEDTSRADAAATVVARRRFDNPPVIDCRATDRPGPRDRGTAIHGAARILDRGSLAFISTQVYTVDPQHQTPLTIVVQRAGRPSSVAPTAGPALEDTD